MALQASGAIWMSQIQTEFGRGNNLNAYRGTQYYQGASGGPFNFPSGTIRFSDFYSKAKNNPVTPGSTVITTLGNGSFVVPNFNTLTITAEGPQGAPGSGGTCGGSAGGRGGLARNVFTAGQVAVGSTIAYSVNGNAAAGSLTGYAGGTGSPCNDVYANNDNMAYLGCQCGPQGSAGLASGGNSVNTNGGSSLTYGTNPYGRVTFQWS
ncbi:MAG: hypothetical protein U1E62_21740 [Alsobacter sp.]